MASSRSERKVRTALPDLAARDTGSNSLQHPTGGDSIAVA
jgi:hypothetical protein